MRLSVPAFLKDSTVALIALGLYLGLCCGEARAETFACVCQADSCGNGVTPGVKGKVFKGIPGLSVERMFGPSRSGKEKTGWECVGASSGEKPPPPKAAKLPADLYNCTCAQESCGGGDAMPGRSGERHEFLSSSFVGAKFQPGGIWITGWQCVNGAGEQYQPPTPDPRQRYSCTCAQPNCGGKDGIVSGERGQLHSGIVLARAMAKYGPSRRGSEATGWVCKAEAPPPPPPKYTCTCSRESCGGQDNILEADKGQKHTGVPATQLPTSYGPERTGAAATGWTCAEERAQTAVAAAPAAPPTGAIAVMTGGAAVLATNPGYTCRCEGPVGCGGESGAPYAKKGEVHEGVPANLINSLYHSDQRFGWSCLMSANAAAAGGILPVDPPYVCRCDGYFGCGHGGAPIGKKGEVRQGVSASQIITLYHADKPHGWVCSPK